MFESPRIRCWEGAIIKYRDRPGLLKISCPRISETFRFGVDPVRSGVAGPRFSLKPHQRALGVIDPNAPNA